MNPLVSFAILIGLFAVGDIIAMKTKAYVSSMFATVVISVGLVWAGVIDPNIIQDSGILGISAIAVPLLLVNIGTLIDVKVLKREWKTILVSLGAFAGLVVGALTIGRVFMTLNESLVAIPMIYGGTISSIMLSQHATEIGIPTLGVYAVMINVTQGIVGMPILSFSIRKEISYLQSSEENFNSILTTSKQSEVLQDPRIIKFPKIFYSPYMGIFFVAILSVLAAFIGVFTEAYFLHAYTLCIIFGVLASFIGLTKKNALYEANAGVLVTFLALLIIFQSLFTGLTPQTLAGLLLPLVGAYIAGIPLLLIGSIIVGKLLKLRATSAVQIGLSAMCGVILSPIVLEEVLRNVDIEESKKASIREFILPKVIIGGIVSMNLLSIIFTSIFMTFIA